MVVVKFSIISNALSLFVQTVQRIFNFADILVLYIFLDTIWKLHISHAFLPLTVAKLSTLENIPVFWPTLYRVVAAS